MANFKDSYRLERIYFEKLKSMIDILKSFLDGETDDKIRAVLENEIDDNGAILLLYRNLGEAWAELADLIQKLRNDLDALDDKEEAYHDELNERIDEVNNYLMALIRALEARMDAVEADLAQMGRLFTYDMTLVNNRYVLTESGNAVTFADTVAKFTHVRPHFVAVRNGSNYYFIDKYDLTPETGRIIWSGWEFTGTGEIKRTEVTLYADSTVAVIETSTNFASIFTQLTNLTGRVSTLEECYEDVEEALEDIYDILNGLEGDLVLYLHYNNGSYYLTDVNNNVFVYSEAVYNKIAAGTNARVLMLHENLEGAPIWHTDPTGSYDVYYVGDQSLPLQTFVWDVINDFKFIAFITPVEYPMESGGFSIRHFVVQQNVETGTFVAAMFR